MQSYAEVRKQDSQIDLDFGVEILPCKSEEEQNVEEAEEGEIDVDIEDDLELLSKPMYKEDQDSSFRSHYKTTSSVSNDGKQTYTRTVYVGDLPKDITSEKLTQIFEQYGDIIDIDIKYLRFGVATYAFIQFVDPLASISAFKNERNCVIDGCSIKIGFGRANIYDTIWIGGYELDHLKFFLDKIQTYQGFIWSLTDKSLSQTIIKFDSIDSSSLAYDKIKSLSPPHNKLTIDFMSSDASRKFISRMEKSNQTVNETILREFGVKKKMNRHPRDSSDEEKISKNHVKRNSHELESVVSNSFDKIPHRLTERNEKLSSEDGECYKKRKRRLNLHESNNSSDNEKRSSITPDDSLSRSRSSHRDKSNDRRLKKLWTGELHLKRKVIHVSFTFFKGNRRVFDACLCNTTKGEEKVRMLQVEQRMVLDDEQYSLINHRIRCEGDFAFAIATIDEKYPDDEWDLKNSFLNYFSQKNAAGVINIHDSKHHNLTHVLYTFPNCSFTSKHTKDIGPELKDIISSGLFILVLALRCQ